MNWNNLKKYGCPKCNLRLKEEAGYHVCEACGFRISDIRYGELLRSKPKFRTPIEEENLSALNNYEK